MGSKKRKGGSKKADKEKPGAQGPEAVEDPPEAVEDLPEEAEEAPEDEEQTSEEIEAEEKEIEELKAKVEAQKVADAEKEEQRVKAVKAEEEEEQKSEVQKAREIRRAKRLKLQKELDDIPPVMAASVHSIKDAKEKREKIEVELKKLKPQTVDLSELDSYRLLHLADVKRNAEDAVKDPLIKQVQLNLDAKVEQLKVQARAQLRILLLEGLKTDKKFLEATRSHTEAINAVIELLTPDLPKGYALSNIAPENKEATATYAPDLRGKLLDIPE